MREALVPIVGCGFQSKDAAEQIVEMDIFYGRNFEAALEGGAVCDEKRTHVGQRWIVAVRGVIVSGLAIGPTDF